MAGSVKKKELILKLITDKYGGLIDVEQMSLVSGNLDRVLDSCSALRRAKLEYSDEPFTVFKPLKVAEK